jgi:hypothetical protein
VERNGVGVSGNKPGVGVSVAGGVDVERDIPIVGNAMPTMDNSPTARRVLSLLETNINCNTPPGGNFSPIQ